MQTRFEFTRRQQFVLVAALFILFAGCAEGPLPDAPSSGAGEPDVPRATQAEKRQIQQELSILRHQRKSDSAGYGLYRSTYKNMVVAGDTKGGTMALVAGTHQQDFPFHGDRPWDNGLLYLNGVGYEFTQRANGEALQLDLVTGAIRSEFRIKYRGEMTRVRDGKEMFVSIEIPVKATRHKKYQLGRPYAFLGGKVAEQFAGMRWRPYELESVGGGYVHVYGDSFETVENLHGEIEHGELVNLQLDRFAFSYDYVSVAAPGRDGYSFIDFTAEPLNPSGMIGYFLGEYMKRFASATMTLQDSGHNPGNIHDVDRPPQNDPTVVLFENEVDLELATLRRQMIRTTDSHGNTVYGLREIFEPK